VKLIFLILALALPLSAQTITVEVDTSDADQKSALDLIVAAKAAALADDAAVTKTWLDSAVVADSLNFSSIGGVIAIADTKDAQWVQVQLDLAGQTGITQKFIAGALKEAVEDEGGKVVDATTVRMRKGRALKFLTALDAALQ
jgi:hypothetical protein